MSAPSPESYAWSVIMLLSLRSCTKQEKRYGMWKCRSLYPSSRHKWCAGCLAREVLEMERQRNLSRRHDSVVITDPV